MAKVELTVVWLLSLVTFVTQSDLMFIFSVGASTTIILRNLPGACKVVKSITRKKKDNV